MTAMKRRFVAATVTIALGVGVHQAWRASVLRNQVQLLQQQAAAHAEQFRQLARDREETASQLARLRQDNERLNRNTAELLKLRAEVVQLKNLPADATSQTQSPEEANLKEEQRSKLKEMSENVRTRNSIADLGRLKDSLERWDELFVTPAPAEWKPVFVVLKQRVQARVAELEQEKSEAPTLTEP
jgi:cell division protein FtsB